MAPTLLAASVAIVRLQDVLLVQRNRPPSAGLWTLPGGRLESGETAEACAEREVHEELGVRVFGLRKLLLLRHGQFTLQTFATQTFDGGPQPDPAEIRDWRWAKPRHLADLKTTPGLEDVVAAAFRLFDRT